ncbi:hypothetical protein B6I21_07965 [candidate division KSB1 bacterium 4572_119]|nr:MAG: hypothetical protein B6I21_07965 [candidate division KSB1 bacterium 4572_119]
MENMIITGVNGLLGQKVLEEAASNFSVLGIDIHDYPFNTKLKFQYERLDLTDRRLVKDTVLKFYPQYIVNAAAFTNVDECENQKELCWKVNVEAVENLIYVARKIGTKIIHISTDYIFDGSAGPYVETDVSAPLGFYGKSKLASENVLLASDVEYAILRTMVLYGAGINVRPNFVTWLIQALKNKQQVTIVTDQFGNPTLADDLAAAVLQSIKLNKWDIFHVSGSEVIDRYNFALKIAEVFGLESELIKATTSAQLNQQALRPLKSGFIVEKAESELGIHLSNAEEGLKKFKRQYKKYR